MKNALTIWKWSLRVIARSPLVLAALAAVVVAGLYGAFRWLYFPMESTVYLLVIGVLWAIVQYFVLVSLCAASVAITSEAAITGANSLDVRKLSRFSRTELLRAAAFVIFALVVAAGIHYLFSWINSYSLEVASWLTFRSEKPVAQETAEAVLIWIERFLWVVVAGFLISFLLVLARDGWRDALRAAPRMLANCCWRTPLVTGLLTISVFGGLAYLLFTWHPTVPPGFLDYAQAIVRNGLALLLAIVGWLFWLLSLARHDSHSESPESTSARGSNAEPSVSDF